MNWCKYGICNSWTVQQSKLNSIFQQSQQKQNSTHTHNLPHKSFSIYGSTNVLPAKFMSLVAYTV